jgi:hypothetical protein
MFFFWKWLMAVILLGTAQTWFYSKTIPQAEIVPLTDDLLLRAILEIYVICTKI